MNSRTKNCEFRKNLTKTWRTSCLKIKIDGFWYGFQDFKYNNSGFRKNLAKAWRTSSLKINDLLFKIRGFYMDLRTSSLKFVDLGSIWPRHGQLQV